MLQDYDSDSGSETESYTTTNVLLGYASKEQTDDSISQLGGVPSWLDPSKPPSAGHAKCTLCQSLMPLLLQLNADMPEHFPGHERRLHIFACKNKPCRRKTGTIRVLRTNRVSASAVKTDKKPEAEKQEPALARNLGSDIFGGSKSTSSNANPFSLGGSTASSKSNPFSTGAANSNPFSTSTSTSAPTPSPSSVTASSLPETFASKARLTSPPLQPPTIPFEPWPSPKSIPSYPPYHLDADYESLDNPPAAPTNLPTNMDIENPTSSSSGASSAPEKEASDAFESTHDRTFQRFADRVSQNPEQVLRYEFQGTPLLYSETDAIGSLLAPRQNPNPATTSTSSSSQGKVATVQRPGQTGIPSCGNCGAKRVFECQLTPHVIVELEAEEEGLDGMEWGTVIVGVCERDCEEGKGKGEVGAVEEWVGVQWEELRPGMGGGKGGGK